MEMTNQICDDCPRIRPRPADARSDCCDSEAIGHDDRIIFVKGESMGKTTAIIDSLSRMLDVDTPTYASPINRMITQIDHQPLGPFLNRAARRRAAKRKS